MSILYRERSIDDSYQVLVHLAKLFQQRRLKCEKITDDERKVTAKGKGQITNVKCYKISSFLVLLYNRKFSFI